MSPTSKLVPSKVLICGWKKGPVARSAFDVVYALSASHAQTADEDRLADIEDRLMVWERRQRDLVAQKIETILANLARPRLDQDSMAEAIHDFGQIQEQGWNLSLFEGLMLHSTHLAGLKRSPERYGRVLDDRDPVDPARGIHIVLELDLDPENTRVLELTESAFSGLLLNQSRGVPDARLVFNHGVWAFPVLGSTEPKATTPPSTPIESFRSTGFSAPRFANSLGMTMVRVEPGEFLMGSDDAEIDWLLKQFPETKRDWYDDEQPQHPVAITRAFYLAMHPVTVGQYRQFVEASADKVAPEWRNPGFAQEEDHPVVNVSHEDVVAFLRWLNDREKGQGPRYRLPTEAEWEYACRAGDRGVYGSTDDPALLDRAAWFSVNSKGTTHPVGQKEKNAFGLHDMLGNAWEWCDDWFDENYYQASPKGNPRQTRMTLERVFRGGSLINAPWNCRPAYRNRYAPDDRIIYLGFRVAADHESSGLFRRNRVISGMDRK